jgi:vancomycin resistance protein YoaR
MSFNGLVGRRTPQAGYRIAGVYVNGRHEVDFGGGICQVSSTLYNAALLANLKIAKRSNHSMPVPYVPLGRDATVDYDSGTDLLIENNSDGPIAVDAEYLPGKLTFRVLGQKVPGQSVKIVQGPRRSWGNGTRVVRDPRLPAGRTVVQESGSAGHALRVTRIVLRDGVEVARESLGVSHYPGGDRIVRVGAARPRPKRSVSDAPAEEPVPEPEPSADPE